MTKLRIQAQHLQPGDIVGSGEVVLYCGVGYRTFRGKVEIYLGKNQTSRYCLWYKYTMISVERANERTALNNSAASKLD